MQKHSLKYRPEIDGLRAVAVGAVVLFHLDKLLPGGFVGVDVFFVISGFLITRIIDGQFQAETFSFKEFWSRRLRRIFPASFVLVLVSLLVGYWLLPPPDLEDLGKATAANALLSANFYYWFDTGYFSAPAELKPLLHTWSLAVEEQFYVFFPILLWALRRSKRRRLFAILTIGAAVSFSLCLIQTWVSPETAFFLLPARAWELLVGALIAILPLKVNEHRTRDTAISCLGLSMLLASFFLLNESVPFPGYVALLPVTGTACVILGTTWSRGTIVERLLSVKPLVWMGLISYSLYLWHWPVIVYVRTYYGQLGKFEAAMAVAIMCVLSILSWRFVEQPLRRPEGKLAVFLMGRPIRATVSVSVVLLLLASFCWGTGGVPSRFPQLKAEHLLDMEWKGNEFGYSLNSEIVLSELPHLGVEEQGRDGGIDFIVWGDSHARTVCFAIDLLAKRNGLAGRAITSSAVLPLPDVYVKHSPRVSPESMLRRNNQVMELLAEEKPSVLVVAARWNLYSDTDKPVSAKLVHVDHPSYQSNQEIVQQSLKDLLSFCNSNGVELWVVKQVPETPVPLPAREWFLYRVGRRDTPHDERLTINEQFLHERAFDRIVSEMKSEGLNVINPGRSLFSEDGELLNYRDDRSVYRDHDHLTQHGVVMLIEALAPLFGNGGNAFANEHTAH